MNFHNTENPIIETLKTIIYSPVFSGYVFDPWVVRETDEFSGPFYGPNNIVVRLKLKNYPVAETNYWVLNCTDQENVTLETLKKLQDYVLNITENRIRSTFIRSRYAFTREAVDFAMKNSIGLARISPSLLADRTSSSSDMIYGTSLLELKNALCDAEFGNRRYKFYGFTTSGRIDQLGSLENYIRKEILNS